MPQDERAELVQHLNRCRDLVKIMKDPAPLKTIEEMVAYLESKLAAMDERRDSN